MSGRALRLVPAGGDAGAGARRALLKLWGEWMRAAGATEGTIATRVDGVRALASHSGQPDVTAFTTAQIVSWLAGCRSQWTRATYATSCRRWHAWLVEQGVRDDDPTERVPKPRWPRGVPRPVTDDALEAVLEVVSVRARAYITLAAYQGLRVHEIAKIRGDDFDGAGWLYVEGKGDVRAALPVHDLVERLRVGMPAAGWWFPGSDGGHVRPTSVTNTVSASFRRAGYPFTAHQLRHLYGTNLQRTTGDIRVTQQLLRHASLNSTQIYTQVSSAAMVAAVRRLGTVGESTP